MKKRFIFVLLICLIFCVCITSCDEEKDIPFIPSVSNGGNYDENVTQAAIAYAYTIAELSSFESGQYDKYPFNGKYYSGYIKTSRSAEYEFDLVVLDNPQKLSGDELKGRINILDAMSFNLVDMTVNNSRVNVSKVNKVISKNNEIYTSLEAFADLNDQDFNPEDISIEKLEVKSGSFILPSENKIILDGDTVLSLSSESIISSESFILIGSINGKDFELDLGKETLKIGSTNYPSADAFLEDFTLALEQIGTQEPEQASINFDVAVDGIEITVSGKIESKAFKIELENFNLEGVLELDTSKNTIGFEISGKFEFSFEIGEQKFSFNLKDLSIEKDFDLDDFSEIVDSDVSQNMMKETLGFDKLDFEITINGQTYSQTEIENFLELANL